MKSRWQLIILLLFTQACKERALIIPTLQDYRLILKQPTHKQAIDLGGTFFSWEERDLMSPIKNSPFDKSSENTSYHLVLSQEVHFSEVLLDTIISDPQLFFPAQLQMGQKYYWKVSELSKGLEQVDSFEVRDYIAEIASTYQVKVTKSKSSFGPPNEENTTRFSTANISVKPNQRVGIIGGGLRLFYSYEEAQYSKEEGILRFNDYGHSIITGFILEVKSGHFRAWHSEREGVGGSSSISIERIE